ncbi:MAG: hypothetical protein ABIR47_11100 [Candidatus Kapaibacterium sp.]
MSFITLLNTRFIVMIGRFMAFGGIVMIPRLVIIGGLMTMAWCPG